MTTIRLLRRIAEILEGLPFVPLKCFSNRMFPETLPYSRLLGVERTMEDLKKMNADGSSLFECLGFPVYENYICSRLSRLTDYLGDNSGMGAMKYACALEVEDSQLVEQWEDMILHQRQSLYEIRKEVREETLERLKEHFVFSQENGIRLIIRMLHSKQSSDAAEVKRRGSKSLINIMRGAVFKASKASLVVNNLQKNVLIEDPEKVRGVSNEKPKDWDKYFVDCYMNLLSQFMHEADECYHRDKFEMFSLPVNEVYPPSSLSPSFLFSLFSTPLPPPLSWLS